MYNKLAEKLQFIIEPVAIYFTNERPKEALQSKEGVRVCVASMLLAAARGKTIVFDEKTYGCPGGGVGLCFGDAFIKNNHPTEKLLSTGDEKIAAMGGRLGKIMERGERFYASPELVKKWKSELPYTETSKKYVVFKPLREIDETDPPDLIEIFANPDQISVLVIMSGFYRGTALNVLAPFSAACQSILLAYQEMRKEFPKAIMGLFDISVRNMFPKELLSFTVPYRMYEELEHSVDESCLTTEAWEQIDGRFK
ncbi:MAG: DUF169 domain-containing protein [Fusobacteriaceae bacterium]|jgi:uncharacterized protein (DUF169 family)|nr:DUF169 domain-containing protein [Fusobacteriaceae bacterium]